MNDHVNPAVVGIDRPAFDPVVFKRLADAMMAAGEAYVRDQAKVLAVFVKAMESGSRDDVSG
jgi:hypothetical protein